MESRIEKLNTVREVRLLYSPHKNQPKRINIKTSLDAYNAIIPSYNQKTIAIQEEFIVMMLNNANSPLCVYKASRGGISNCLVDVRLIMATALKSLCTSLIISHNHPSGKVIPSTADLSLTKKIKDACSLFDIQLLDHLIVDPYGSFASLGDQGLI